MTNLEIHFHDCDRNYEASDCMCRGRCESDFAIGRHPSIEDRKTIVSYITALESKLHAARALLKKYEEAIEEHHIQSAKGMVMAKDFHLYNAIEAATKEESNGNG